MQLAHHSGGAPPLCLFFPLLASAQTLPRHSPRPPLPRMGPHWPEELAHKPGSLDSSPDSSFSTGGSKKDGSFQNDFLYFSRERGGAQPIGGASSLCTLPVIGP